MIASLLDLYLVVLLPEVARKELLFLGTQHIFWKSPFEALQLS